MPVIVLRAAGEDMVLQEMHFESNELLLLNPEMRDNTTKKNAECIEEYILCKLRYK